MNFIKNILIIALFTSFIGCKEEISNIPLEQPTDNIVSTFYFIRHAEKDRSNKDNHNPELNQEGLGRSIFWAKVFEPIALDNIYTTDYERTEMTAAPTAIQKELTVKSYDPKNIDTQQFKVDNLGKNVLVVGHSNTTPDFVNKILGEDKYPLMQDDDNGSLYIVTLVGDQATAIKLNIAINTP